MLAALRRRLLITTWVIVSSQSLVLALGTAQVCVDREHTHAGVAAPDCAMHHRGAGGASGDAHHGHHGASSAGTDVQISCRCSTEVPPTMLGESGIIERPLVIAPSFHVELLTRPAAGSVPERVRPPSSPPPR